MIKKNEQKKKALTDAVKKPYGLSQSSYLLSMKHVAQLCLFNIKTLLQCQHKFKFRDFRTCNKSKDKCINGKYQQQEVYFRH